MSSVHGPINRFKYKNSRFWNPIEVEGRAARHNS
jgi:hypothetical protein